MTDEEFEALKRECKAVGYGGKDNKKLIKVLEEGFIKNMVALFIDSKVEEMKQLELDLMNNQSDQSPNLQDCLGVKIPTRKRSAANKTHKPDHAETAAPSNLQLSQSACNNSRKHVPDCVNKGKKPIEYKIVIRDKGKRKLIEPEHDHNEERNVKKKHSIPKKVELARLGLDPPPGLSEELTRFIKEKDGSAVKLLLTKNLYKTDLQKRHDRLSIPVSQVKESFLKEAEEKCLIGEDHNIGVNVVVADGDKVIDTYKMKLRYWNTNGQYALTSSWMGVVEKNREMLTVNSIVQVWSFRIEDQLWLLLVKIRDPTEEDDVIMLKGGDNKGGDEDDTKNNGGDAASSDNGSASPGCFDGSNIIRDN